MRRRVVVTGIGMINPMGHDAATVWSGLQEGRSGVAPTTLFDATGFPTKISAEVKNWDIADCGESAELWRNRGRHTKFAVGAAKQAIADSGVLDSISDPVRFGVYLGSGEGNQDFATFSKMMAVALADGQYDAAKFIAAGIELLDPAKELEQEPNMPAAHLATMFNAQGPNLNCLTACAASSQAVGEASEIIRRGDADVMLAGGTHSMIHPFGVTGFNLLTALSESNEEPTKASRPFDRLRNGFVLGEGSAMVTLEELESAKARGATIYGEVAGYGTTADAYRITDIPPDGHGGIAAMRMAIADAGLQPSDINYVNAHGTSTTVNDKVETKACKEVFGDQAAKIPVSSTKSMMGHLIAAAGVTEMIVCLLAIRDSVLPPTINYENPDPDCDLDYVPNEAREAPVNHALNNSFGFGGQNVTLCLSRFGKIRSRPSQQMNAFTDAELAAFLDEALPAGRCSQLEHELRSSAELRDRLIEVRGRETAGLHTIGAIWRRARLSCPSRTELGQYILGTLAAEPADYIRFHLDTVGCRYCHANLHDLEAASKMDDQPAQGQRYFQTSAGYLKDKDA